jgi:tetratricopeptide (TPR) repeat protein
VKSAAPSTPASPATSFDEASKKAQEARDAGRLAEAIDLYRAALQQKPDWTEGEWIVGLLLYQLKRHEEARDVFAQVALRAPKHGRSWAMKGLCEFALGRHEVAAQDLAQALDAGIEGDPRTEAVARYHLALAYNRLGAFEDAFAILKTVIPVDPEGEPLLQALGMNLLRLPLLPADVPEAQRELVVSMGRAGSHMLNQKRPAARKIFADLVKRYPDTPNVHFAYGAFLKTEEPDAALEQWKRELEISPEHVPARLLMALEYLDRGEHAAALPYARDAASLAPHNPVARNTYGRALVAAGKSADAIRELEAGLQLDPGNAKAHFALAKAYGDAGRKEDAARERATFLKLSQE